MFTKQQVEKLAKEAFVEFSKSYKIDCEIELISLDEFWKLAKKSKLIQDDIKKRIPLKVGSLVVHGKVDRICLNLDIINNLSSDPMFVKALVVHELSHVYLKNKVEEDSLDEEIKSENRADKFLERRFPQYFGYFV